MSGRGFIALDVETANADLASICQVGVVAFSDGAASSSWSTYVDPEDFFDGWNVAIHGITEETVAGAPTFARIAGDLAERLSGRVVASHMAFDRLAVTRAAERAAIPELACTWIDTARVVRRAWPERARRGYALGKVAKALGIDYRAHDALEDARAAGEILLRAMAETGLDLPAWLHRVEQPISEAGPIAREGNPDGPLAGEVVVFTGALSLPRAEAAALAAEAGCDVGGNVTKKTTLLVVGDQDTRKLAGHEKSNKHRKAEDLIAEGHAIRLLGESDFRRLVGTLPSGR